MKHAGIIVACFLAVTTGAATNSPGELACAYDDRTIAGGLRGYCTELSPQHFRIRYTTFAGNEVLALEWPGALRNPVVTDCSELCQAGALQIVYRQPTAAPRASAAPRPGGGCPLSANAAESYETGELCGSGEAFRCHGACGKGCIGCEVEFDKGFCPPLCQSVSLSCYTRPCCAAHDDCLASATTPDEELACHVQAGQNGCTLDDADGTTNNLPDADCLDFHICREWPEIEDPPWEEPIEH